METEQVIIQIKNHLPGAQVIVESEDHVHFDAVVICDSFEGLNRVQRQQKVYAALGDLITSGALHALALKTYTTSQWEAKRT